MVCQGVPYGTSLWQVTDSSKQNGYFKSASSEVKEKILKKRLYMMMDSPSIMPTDIIPIINHAWDQSFARVHSILKAIAARGLGPMNYNLLTHKQIQLTMTRSEEFIFVQSSRSKVMQNNNHHQLPIHPLWSIQHP